MGRLARVTAPVLDAPVPHEEAAERSKALASEIASPKLRAIPARAQQAGGGPVEPSTNCGRE